MTRVAAEKVAANMARLRKAFLGAIERAQEMGEVSSRKDAGALAEFLAACVYSIGMLRRAGQDTAFLKRYVQTALEALT